MFLLNGYSLSDTVMLIICLPEVLVFLLNPWPIAAADYIVLLLNIEVLEWRF